METMVTLPSSFSCFSHNLLARPDISPVVSNPMLSKSWIEQKPSSFHIKLSNRKSCNVIRKSTRIRASNSRGPIAPLQLVSPVGQFLSQILVSHPHLVPAAVDQQLEQLQTDRDAENEKKEPSASSSELVLYRRIAEVKANERKKALEEILYTLVVQKFIDANISLIPTVTSSSPDKTGQVDMWPSQEEKLKLLHSLEAYEMIQSHLSFILGDRLGDPSQMAELPKVRVGQVYAASLIYGYFLKRVDQRFQLEKKMKNLPQGENSNFQEVIENETRPNGESNDDCLRNARAHPEMSSWSGGIESGDFGGVKLSRLKSYVMSFDGETLKRYASIRSNESVSIFEKHTEALFGRPEIVITPQGTLDFMKDETVNISFDSLTTLILEAVTFGSFLWDAESYVDSRYGFVAN